MADAFLALGSNLGDRAGLIRAAVQAIAELPGVQLRQCSSHYRTAPVGPVAQDWFINAVIHVESEQAPQDLLAACHAIEHRFGRDRNHEVRWGPRTLDIDLIAWGDRSVSEEGLILPHPRFAERAFVIVPLFEIAPDITIGGLRVRDLYTALDRSGVERIAPETV